MSTAPTQRQWLREVSLVVADSGASAATAADLSSFETGTPRQRPATFSKGRDLSEMHFVFQVQQSDVETPNNAAIRIYNLSDSTVREVRNEYDQVVLRAGYTGAKIGIVFQGTIKQFRVGRENATDTYLDILAADGDIGYNWGFLKDVAPLAAGSTADQRLRAISQAMGMSVLHAPDLTGTELIRGKVLFGMARAEMSVLAESNNCTWSIQDGQLSVVTENGYIPGAIAEINSGTGMIGIPELTEEGIKLRTLLNPAIQVGGLIHLNNASINKLVQQNPDSVVPFNQWTGIQRLAKIAADGYYRVYVVEHSGDTRGNQYYSDIIALAVDFSSKKVQAQP